MLETKLDDGNVFWWGGGVFSVAMIFESFCEELVFEI